MAPPWVITMPWQMYNTISILIAALLLCWLLHALRRAQKMWNLRAAVLSSRLVQVRGLGSYLEYFSGATDGHVNHMIHTRQVEPPTHVRSLHIPFSLQSVKLDRLGKQSVALELEFWSDVPCRILVLSHFRADIFKQRAAKDSFDVGTSGSDGSDREPSSFYSPNEKGISLTAVQGSPASSKRILPDGGPASGSVISIGSSSSSSSGSGNTSGTNAAAGSGYSSMRTGVRWVDRIRQRGTGGAFLQRAGCCSEVSSVAEVKAVGQAQARPLRLEVRVDSRPPKEHQVATPGSSVASNYPEFPVGSGVGSTRDITVEVAEAFQEEPAIVLGILIVPLEAPSFRVAGGSPAAAAAGGGGVGHGDGDAPGAGAGAGAGVYPDSDSEVVPLEFGVTLVTVPAKAMSGASDAESPSPSTPLSLVPSEFIMCANGGTLYSAVEIFGFGGVGPASKQQSLGFLHAALATPEKEGTQGASSSSSPAVKSDDGARGEDECVVCLENTKEVLLLPCRHMCVCTTCLAHIDKCPVCRSQFEEYICMMRDSALEVQDETTNAFGDSKQDSSDQPHSVASL